MSKGGFRNNTFGPFFDNRSMGYENMVHYWHLKKKLDLFVKLWWPSRFFLQNRRNCIFQSPTREFILSQIRNIQEFIKSASVGLET